MLPAEPLFVPAGKEQEQEYDRRIEFFILLFLLLLPFFLLVLLLLLLLSAPLPRGERGRPDPYSFSSRPNWEYLRERLHRLDGLVGAAAVEALDADQAQELRVEAARSAERHRDRVDARALEEVTERLYRLRARERLRLPRVSVI